jgi:hypothetical protein
MAALTDTSLPDLGLRHMSISDGVRVSLSSRARRNAIFWPLYRTIFARLSCDCDTNAIKCDTNCYRVVR